MVSKIPRPRVLLIEKNRHILKILESCTDKHHAKLTKILENDSKKLQISKQRYSLLIIDFYLAQSGNPSLLSKIREKDFNLPVIVIGPNNHTAEIQAYELGANIYHSKPIKCDLLRAQIARFNISYFSKSRLQLKDIIIDLNSQSFLIHNLKIIFTYQEFYLLHLLVKANGQILTKDSISQHFFNNHKEISYAAIDTLVSRIRSKLRNPLIAPFIETKYKLGYRVNPVYLRDSHIEKY